MIERLTEPILSPSAPQVNFRETIQRRASFDYLHKKQSGGSGQYGRVAGYIEPMSPEEVQSSGDGESEKNDSLEFVNEIVGTAIPSQFIPAIEKGKYAREEAWEPIGAGL